MRTNTDLRRPLSLAEKRLSFDGRSLAGVRGVGGPQGPFLLQQQGRVGDDELPHLRASLNLERRVPLPRPISALQDIYTRVYRYILFVTVVTSWWLGITFGNAAYFAVITFTTVGLGDFAPPFLHHDTTYADVVGQYLLFAASSLLGLVLLALLLKALDELLQKRLSKGIDRVAAGVLAMRRRYSSDGSRGRRRGRRASGGSRDDTRASSTTSA